MQAALFFSISARRACAKRVTRRELFGGVAAFPSKTQRGAESFWSDRIDNVETWACADEMIKKRAAVKTDDTQCLRDVRILLMNQERVTGNPISLIFPRSSSPDELLTILMDVQQFFSKWPAMPEIFVPFLPPPAATANTLNRMPAKGLQLLNNAGLGYGAAVREGLKRSKAEFSFVLDLPLEFPLADVFQAWMEFESRPEVDIVVGSRRHPQASLMRDPRKWQWKWDSWLNDRIHQHVGSSVADSTTSFYGYRIDRVKPLSEEIRDNGFSFAARLIKKAEQDRLKISEKPVHWNPTPDSLSRYARDQWNLLKMTFV